MLSPDALELLSSVPFRDAVSARQRLDELADDAAEMLALVEVAPRLAEALPRCADPDAALRNLVRFAQARGARLPLFHLFRDHPLSLDALVQVLGASRYLADVLVRNPEFFELVADSTLLRTPRAVDELAGELDQICAPFATSAAQLDAVRRFRRREILRIGAADLLGLADLRRTIQQLSHLADAVVRQCLKIVGAHPTDPAGLIVLALGKLGGSELNYSSDIDLILLAEDARRVQSATRVARRLIAALGEASGEGFLYRVDLRLRPFGGAGALVVSTDMMLDYLASQAHPAERQAMLKARVVAGAAEPGRRFLDSAASLLSVDAAAAREHVRLLKERIERQLADRGQSAGHVKLAPGGIRDVEFVVQALQIEAAREQPELAGGNTLQALARLAAAGAISRAAADDLREAYVFLRLVEHRLQLMDNQQVHRLPEEPLALKLLARTLGFEGPEEGGQLQAAYQSRVQTVRALFERFTSATERAALAAAVAPPLRAAVSAQLESVADAVERCELDRHAEILAGIERPEDVQVVAQRESQQHWTVSIAACDRVGLLSMVTGLLAAGGYNVASGDVFTLRFPKESRKPVASRGRRRPPQFRSPQPRSPSAAADVSRKVLDIFTVRSDRWRERAEWQVFQAELAALVALLAAGDLEAARERIIERVSRPALQGPRRPTPLYPVTVEVDNDASDSLTRLSIRSTDSLGFLFEFASALAALRVNIERVEIRTVGHEVRDTFWVTDDSGRKIREPDRIHELRVAAALIKQFTHLLPQSPDPAQALRQFSSLTRQLLSRPDWTADVQSLQSDAVLSTLADLLGVSQFLWEDFLRMQHENLFPVLRDIPALDEPKSKARLEQDLATRFVESSATGTSFPFVEQVARLNRFKDREMFRIDLRHITRRIDLDQFSGELSDLAEVVVAAACELCHAQLTPQYGVPRLAEGRACGWGALALGKFGGRELGFASDIELVFVYEGEGQTDGPRSLTNALYFEELVAAFLRTLSSRREGVFEIDLRLRPHGKGGSLASSLAGFAGYFSPAGPAEQFERLALVKLRPVAGVSPLGERIVQARDAFVYSQAPLDYENILHLRSRQAAELVPPRKTSAKHSPGGIVDVEYFVQARQIEAGRDQPNLRVTSTHEAIRRLEQSGLLSSALAHDLAGAHRFLRQLIEALRVVRGHAKDLTLPASGTLEFTHLARRLGYDSPAALEREIARHMRFARDVWQHR